MTVERILSDKGREVVTLPPRHTIGEATRLMAERRIGAVVIRDVGTGVLGILSERDIVRAIAAKGPPALDEPISDFMTARVVTCRRTVSVHDVMELMTEGKFRHVPVVEEGELVGIVSIGDIVKHRLAEVEAEHDALKEYIATA